MQKLSPTLILSLLLLAGGCYRYVPTEMGVVPRGSEVRVHLTGDGSEKVRSTLGPNVFSVTGPLVEWNEEGLAFLAELSLSRPGFPATTMPDTIDLLPRDVARVELREIDRKRTAGLTVAIIGVAAAAALVPRVVGGTSKDDTEGGGPGPEAAILFRVPIRIGIR